MRHENNNRCNQCSNQCSKHIKSMLFKNSLIQNERIAATKYMRGASLLKWA